VVGGGKGRMLVIVNIVISTFPRSNFHAGGVGVIAITPILAGVNPCDLNGPPSNEVIHLSER